MKVSHLSLPRLLALPAVLIGTACVPAPEPTPAPEAAETPPQVASTPSEPARTTQPKVESSAAVTVATPQYDNWLDAPRTSGSWTYSASELASGRYSSAEFAGPNGWKMFTLTCSASGNVVLKRWVSSVGDLPITIRTETAERTLIAPRDPEGRTMVAAVLPASDPLLDAIALTRGRFAVETPEKQTLYLPAWAEVTRVIEDCR